MPDRQKSSVTCSGSLLGLRGTHTGHMISGKQNAWLSSFPSETFQSFPKYRPPPLNPSLSLPAGALISPGLPPKPTLLPIRFITVELETAATQHNEVLLQVSTLNSRRSTRVLCGVRLFRVTCTFWYHDTSQVQTPKQQHSQRGDRGSCHLVFCCESKFKV